MKRLLALLVPLIAVFSFAAIPSDASVDSPASPVSVERPAHNVTTLGFFSCAASRPGTGHPNLTINHSHFIAAESTVDPVFGQPAIDAYDCEGYEPDNLQVGCNWRINYVHDNKLYGQDLGILTAVRVNCFS